jgi:hypothetical protein
MAEALLLEPVAMAATAEMVEKLMVASQRLMVLLLHSVLQPVLERALQAMAGMAAAAEQVAV